jgi:hypothetical protein
MRSEKLFALTHSSIPTIGYASTTKTVGEPLKLTSLEKQPVNAIGPRGMRPVCESTRGDYHVEGFEGQTASDHIDRSRRWARRCSPTYPGFWSRSP